MKYILSIILFVTILNSALSQEFKCNVSVSTQQIQRSNKELYKNMQTAIYEFINNRRWTDNVFNIDERIECNLFFTISDEISANEFKGKLQIQARRPVYNSSYSTTLFNYIDNDIQFKYEEFETLEFSDSQTNSELTSLIAYYLNIILGLDYDSFEFEGGTQYFQKAESILNRMQGGQFHGWGPYSSRTSRYWIVENLLNRVYSPLREMWYYYHRQGLDIMHNKLNDGRATIADNIEKLRNVYRNKTDHNLYFELMLNAKSEEFMNIFIPSFNEERMRVYNVLIEVDPIHSDKYNKIKTGKN